MFPTRIQIMVGDTLVAEAVVENDWIAYTLWSKWAVLRYKRNLPIGGACICRADIARTWKIPVGETMNDKNVSW